MSFCIALAVRDLRMTIDEALPRRRSAAPGRCGATTSGASPPAPAPTPSCSTRPRYAHLVYRPGVPLVAGDLRAGEVVAGGFGQR